MKVTLYLVSSDNWVDSELAGLYTEEEFENLKDEIIANYRECDEYVYDIQNSIDELLICKVALGKKDKTEDFKKEVQRIEDWVLKTFIEDYVTIYEKEI